MIEITKLAYDALNDLPVGVLWFDKDARFFEVNKAACEYWGYTREEFLQLTIFDVNPKMKPEGWAAELLGMRPTTLYSKIERLEIKRSTDVKE